MPAIQQSGMYKDNLQLVGEALLGAHIAQALSERSHVDRTSSSVGAHYPHRAATADDIEGARRNRELKARLV